MPALADSALATPLRPDNCALVLIDHQTGLLQFLPSVEPAKLRANITALSEIGTRFELPTVLTSSWPTGPNGPTLSEITSRFSDIPVIERDTVDVWEHPETAAAIRAMDRPKLIMAALDTTTCLCMAAFGAVRAGFDVYAVIDASSTFDELNQQAAMNRLQMAGVVVTTWIPVLAELAGSTVKNGIHIAELLSTYNGNYAAVWSNFIATARDADMVVGQLDQARAAL